MNLHKFIQSLPKLIEFDQDQGWLRNWETLAPARIEPLVNQDDNFQDYERWWFAPIQCREVMFIANPEPPFAELIRIMTTSFKRRIRGATDYNGNLDVTWQEEPQVLDPLGRAIRLQAIVPEYSIEVPICPRCERGITPRQQREAYYRNDFYIHYDCLEADEIDDFIPEDEDPDDRDNW